MGLKCLLGLDFELAEPNIQSEIEALMTMTTTTMMMMMGMMGMMMMMNFKDFANVDDSVLLWHPISMQVITIDVSRLMSCLYFDWMLNSKDFHSLNFS